MNTIEVKTDTLNKGIREYLTNFDTLPYGVAVLKNDQFSTLLRANQAFYQTIGYTEDQFLEKHKNHIADILIDDICDRSVQYPVVEEFDNHFDLRICAADESICWVHGFTHYDTQLDVFFLTITDISDKLVATARHLSYDALQVRNEILGHLNIHTNEHITVTDADTDEVMYLNPPVCELLGFQSESDWRGKHYCDLAFGSKENTPASYYLPLSEDEFTESEQYNTFYKRYLNVKSKLINVSKLNRKMRVNITTDITAQKQLEARIVMRDTLHNCLEMLFKTTTAADVSDGIYYDVLKQIGTYYDAEGAFFYKFVDGTHRLEKIYRVLSGEIQSDNSPFLQTISDEQVQLLQTVSAMTVEQSRNATQQLGNLVEKSFAQFHVNYEVQQFSSVTVNNDKGEIIAFMGVANPHTNEDTKELLELLSRFICMFLEHQQDQKVKDEAVMLEETSKANLVNKCATNFQNSGYAKENITDALDALCVHYDADFAMIIHGNKDDDNYGVHYMGGNSIPDLSAFQNQPRYTMDKWAKTFQKHSQFVTDVQVDSPVSKMILKNQFGIYNFIAAPLKNVDGILTGLVFVCNYKLMNRSQLAVHIVAKNIADYLERMDFKEKAQLEPANRLENKATAQTRISALLEKDEVGTLFVMDIDNFRQLNDTLGHRVGDQIIVEFTDSLQQIFQSADVIARIGGDEFMVFTQGFLSGDTLEKTANQILKKCHHYYNKDGLSVEISVSIGVCCVSERYKTFQPLYENADYALYVAKKSGKNRYHIYSDKEYLGDTAAADELRFYPNVVEKLKSAIGDRRFVVHYQPLYHVPTGAFTQAEALVRMRKPDGSLIYPNDFIQVAESSGLVVEMTYQILEQVCQDFRQLLNQQPNTTLTSIAINVPYLQFADPNMEDRFLEILEKYRIDPSQIKLEITERSIITDMDLMMSKIASLKEKGFNFELDDFGTNYSNLQMCISLPLEVTKLDRSLLLAALTTEEGRCFFEHIVAGIHATGRQTVMEGVETQEQLEWATKLNCEHIQGYYFSKPVDFDGFADFLKTK